MAKGSCEQQRAQAGKKDQAGALAGGKELKPTPHQVAWLRDNLHPKKAVILAPKHQIKG